MKKNLLILFSATFLMSCGGSEETDSENSDGQTAETSETVEVIEEAPLPEWTVDTSAEVTIKTYLLDNGWEGQRHESGMYVVIDEVGKGDERPDLLDEVTIHYKGFLLDGTQFDGTETERATFALNQLITGWQIGIPYFGKGGKGKLVIPPGLAYGAGGSGPVPPNATLMFEIELLDFKKAKKQHMHY